MSEDWPELFKEFFEDQDNQERFSVVAKADGARELWLQGELLYWFRKKRRPSSKAEFWVNRTVNSTEGNIRPDLVFGEWDDKKESWAKPPEMVAELKFLGYSFQPKTIYGGTLKEIIGLKPLIIKPEICQKLLEPPKKRDSSTDKKPKPPNSLVRDYGRLLGINNPETERYLILICSKFDDGKNRAAMANVLDNIEFEMKTNLTVEITEKPGLETLPTEHPQRQWSVKIWPITGVKRTEATDKPLN